MDQERAIWALRGGGRRFGRGKIAVTLRVVGESIAVALRGDEGVSRDQGGRFSLYYCF